MPLRAQLGVTTFGIQVKPVIPLEFFDPRVEFQEGALKGSAELTGGFAFGMLMRFGFTKFLSMEVGINQVRRNYAFSLMNDTAGFEANDRIRYVGYEIPVLLLAYVRLTETLWMNGALGPSVDFYPSDAVREVLDARAYVTRQEWAQLGAVGNIGMELRTRKAGYFYFGATYHRAFGAMARANLTYYSPTGVPTTIADDLSGSYLTVDLRYFFHEDPDRLKRPRN
ncbi:MAG: hypothetical protein KA175_07970 [Flavobacteriales bacterium]|nr:hypothetical protein [Flavobacteriales bacterium]